MPVPTAGGARPWSRSDSSRISRRPADSAHSSTGPLVLAQEMHQVVGGRLVALVAGQVGRRPDRGLLVHRRIGLVAQFQHRVIAENLVQLLYRGKAAPGGSSGRRGSMPYSSKRVLTSSQKWRAAAVVVAGGDNCRVVRQVVKQGGAVLEKQGQVIFTAPRAASCADLDIDGAVVVVDVESCRTSSSGSG